MTRSDPSRSPSRSGGRPRPGRARLVLALGATALVLSTLAPTMATADTSRFPYQDPDLPVPERVADLMSRMSLEDKLGQMTQVERTALGNRQDLATYRIGSILSGGGSAPSPNTATAWADMYDEFQKVALSTPLGIPMIYGVDAVHGHNNVYGATIFPHNIGLGATRDPELVRQIGAATAREVAGTGVDWTFAPCLCVARNDRWGRTYESYGERPEIATALTTIVTGLQGTRLDAPDSVLATAKHYVGDGGTTGGVDQGNTEVGEAELRELHLEPYRAAVAAGVGSVMVSYNSWNGAKMHANRYLVTDVLKGELGFSGFVVSDWEGIDKIDDRPGLTAEEVRLGVNAGIDMVMVPHDFRRFLGLLRQEVEQGRIPMSRIDDANRRILTKKFELGLFEHPFTDRSFTPTIGSAQHRALARQAVRQSMVLLKNERGVLPLPKTADKIFVAGKSADDIGNQSGGWTISWQGDSGDITPGTTILEGIRTAVSPSTTVTFNRDGHGIDNSYRVAIAVVGETPYAEFEGDRPGSMGLDGTDLAVLARLEASGVPLVVVLVSGRPLDIAPELDGWDALVAAWLPGTEGQGVADVLFGDHEPTGKLPMTWMRSADQQPINIGDGKPALFPYGYGQRFPASKDAFEVLGATYYDEQSGTRLERCSDAGGGQNVGWIGDGDYLGYYEMSFEAGAPIGVLTRVASGSVAAGSIEYRLDSPTGPAIASVPVSNTGGWQNWTTIRAETTPQISGTHRLYLVFHSPSGQDFVNVNWFRFTR
ncbi:beta-glucosidase [Longimycelium tulufanense]|uniref:beta-glucosidase n=1 Tax=Longimycelium tulufanense TaxID=907463 RepID=A0A8J3CC98_9PSEU|nr:beta-glucosidase [Longimycelium tulufanense]